jgi:putative inorganic carbon (hco3(-)) transporter
LSFKNHTNRLRDVPLGFWAGSLVFLLCCAIFIYSENTFLLVLSVLPLLAFYSIFEFEKLYYFAVFFTPFSIGLEKIIPDSGFNISLPTELFLMALSMILFFKLVAGRFFDRRIFLHPISIAILAYLTWMFITSVSSSMPLVSLKHFIARCWFVLPLYFLPVVLFKNTRLIWQSWWLYIIPFTIVILYSLMNHLSFGLNDKKAAHFVMQPFYNDHTSYGAILAMYIPVLLFMLFSLRFRTCQRVIVAALTILFCVALVLSYTRAAWISMLSVGVLALLIYFKIQVRYVAIAAIVAVSILFVYRVEIIDTLNKNKQDSSEQLKEHVKSISNIATDASNVERINRWNSAIAMFYERPLLGWGPGTYMFQYAPFQMAGNRTIISTNFGEGGNAHSEYIGPLAEQGVLGLLTILAVAISFVYTSLKVYFKSNQQRARQISFISLMSVTTYLVHGLLNNYLDTDKASVPFWGFLAIVCSLDLYSNKNPQPGGAEER